MKNDYFSLIKDCTDSYLSKLNDSKIDIDVVRYDLIKIVNDEIDKCNLGPRDENTSKTDPIKVQYPYRKEAGKKFKNLLTFHPYQVAKLCVLYCNAKRIFWVKLEDKDNFSLAVYHNEGLYKGIYDVSNNAIDSAIRFVAPLISVKDLVEVKSILMTISPCVIRNDNRDLIAVNNGIFDYKNKKLLDFDPKYVFLSKSSVDFKFGAKLINIEMPDGKNWNIEDWYKSLSDDKEVINSLWEITSAILRPNVDWNKAIFFHSPIGNNGKGTFCTLLRNLLGSNAVSSIPIGSFSKDFMLTPLLKVNAVICDENNTGGYLENAENFKLAVTKDPMRINIKNKEPKDIVFNGLLVQCVNDIPKVKDKTSSFYRRLLTIPMDKKFEGIERKYIKNDYMFRKDVLEYVLNKALMTNFYELSIPEVSLKLKDEIKEANDPVRQFYTDIFEDISWKLLPNTFLFDLYKAWREDNMPYNNKISSSRTLVKELKTLLVEELGTYEYMENRISGIGRMDFPEPLIIKYNLKKWFNKSYKGNDEDMIVSPVLDSKGYRGFLKVKDPN